MRPFQILGFSRLIWAKCASISARRSRSNGHARFSTFRSSAVTRWMTALLGIHPRRLGLLDIFVGVGLGYIDIGLGDLRRAFAEHREHGSGALGVHLAGLRIHRDGVLERGEIERLILADHLLRH